jgi:8-oxo-dGTP pyrophosphatase MutT (NUDIX family)
MAQKMVLVLLVQGQHLFLGHKMREVGKGSRNAPGGKPEPEDGGDLRQTSVREVYQECGVTIMAEDLKQVALLNISREGVGPEYEVTVFRADHFTGEMVGTDELGRLVAYCFDDIDYSQMMPADRLWLPAVLAGLTIEVDFTYDRERKEVTYFKMFQKNFV